MESDEDSSSSSPRQSSTSSSHTNPRSNKQSEKNPVIDLNQLDVIYRNGKAEDQFKYGQMYEEGNGVDRDCTKALNWYQRAADQHHPEAQFKLGVIYANGLGVEKSVDRALSWLLPAAMQGHTKAQSIYDSLALSADLKSNTNSFIYINSYLNLSIHTFLNS
jgi:TPR repeat protein